jgi:primosomal protein DnaI
MKVVASNEILDAIDKNYQEALKDANFKKLVDSLKVDEEAKKYNTSKLQDSVLELINCKNCKGLNCCKNRDGYVCCPKVYNNSITFEYIPCKYKKEQIEKENNKMTREKELELANLDDVDKTIKSRLPLMKWVVDFIKKYDTTTKHKGLYLHGPFGSGKSYIIAAVFNKLKENGVRTEIVYFPTLLRDLKANFDELESTMAYLENVDLLLLDDIGAEKVSEWSRDEILGTILQSRMNNYKTTFFTSNYTIDELEDKLSNKTDKVAAARVVERIKVLTDDIELKGENRRKDM